MLKVRRVAERPVRKTLTQVAIGPYVVPEENSILVTDSSTEPGNDTLGNVKMGMISSMGTPACRKDLAACYGRVGAIPLHTPILNPAFEDTMITYLRIFNYVSGPDGPYLEMKPGVRDAISTNRTLSGYRLLKTVSEMVAGKGGKWQKAPDVAGVQHKIGESTYVLDGEDLRRALRDATRRYTAPDADVRLEELGLHPEVAKPEDFIICHIPVLPNSMRMPFRERDVHPLTMLYKEVLEAVDSRDPRAIRNAYLQVIKNGEKTNLKEIIFSSSKKGFLRGGMLSKVGGQIARSVVAPSISVKPTEVGVPRRFALDISQRIEVTDDNVPEIRQLIEEGHITHILDLETREYIRIDKRGSLELKPRKMLVLRELQEGDLVIANRQPSLHRNSMLAFRVKLHDDDVIYIHPSATTGFGMDLRN